jgi:hypothetical protein
MNATSPPDPSTGNSPHQALESAAPKAVPDYRGAFVPLVEAKDSRMAVLLSCLATVPASIARWPPRHFIALAVVGVQTFVAVQILAAREALGPVLTLAGVLAVALPVAIIGVIALLKNETSHQRSEEPPQLGDERGGTQATGATPH